MPRARLPMMDLPSFYGSCVALVRIVGVPLLNKSPSPPSFAALQVGIPLGHHAFDERGCSLHSQLPWPFIC